MKVYKHPTKKKKITSFIHKIRNHIRLIAHQHHIGLANIFSYRYQQNTWESIGSRVTWWLYVQNSSQHECDHNLLNILSQNIPFCCCFRVERKIYWNNSTISNIFSLAYGRFYMKMYLLWFLWTTPNVHERKWRWIWWSGLEEVRCHLEIEGLSDEM